MTFSLIARCAATSRFGMVIASSSPAVTARCAYARAGVGAVASQNVTDPRLGVAAPDLLESGFSATRTVESLRLANEPIDFRQVLVIGCEGAAAIHSGERALGTWAEASGAHSAADGNLLADAGLEVRCR